MSSVPDCSDAIVPNSKRRRHRSPPAASSSSSHSSSTTQKEELEDEEEDMAKCLILLAQGPAAIEAARVMPAPRSRPKSTGSRRFLAAAEARGGVCVSYECKTCNRCFPSFQALGGHRTSHNKHPRRPAEEVLAAMAITTTLSLAATRPAHECSSCGSVFTSGQALGGHMRRHRPLTTSSSPATGTEDQQDSSSKLLQESRINLELDLNLLPSTEQEVTSPPPKPPCHAPAAASPIDHIQGCCQFR